MLEEIKSLLEHSSFIPITLIRNSWKFDYHLFVGDFEINMFMDNTQSNTRLLINGEVFETSIFSQYGVFLDSSKNKETKDIMVCIGNLICKHYQTFNSFISMLKVTNLKHKVDKNKQPCLFHFNDDIDYNELVDRIIEFEVIKNGQLDMISINGLYDYYNCEFNEQLFSERLHHYFRNTTFSY